MDSEPVQPVWHFEVEALVTLAKREIRLFGETVILPYCPILEVASVNGGLLIVEPLYRLVGEHRIQSRRTLPRNSQRHWTDVRCWRSRDG
jgi:hypothetical protein